jgi:hypothetical protein
MVKLGQKFVPMVRVYWKQGKLRGHSDCVVEDGLEVFCG